MNCSLNLFKINSNELLLLQIPFSNFENQITPENSPRVVSIGTNSSITYRLYSDVINNAFVCATITPASPVVEKEWNASGGTIEIITDALYDVDGITINGYTHNIKFKNVNFSNPDNSFSFTEYIFGNYETDL